MEKKIMVIKKGGEYEDFNPEKIIIAARKSADRVNVEITDEMANRLVTTIKDRLNLYSRDKISVAKLHTYVETALEDISPKIAESYRNYRNFKLQFATMMERVTNEAEAIMYRGDKENANKDSSLVSTQGALIRSKFSTEIYKNQFLTEEELAAVLAGFFYVHDMDLRMFTMNCCLFLMQNVLRGGFEMGNIFYTEPNSLEVAFDVISDIVLSAASQQYGGFTIPQVDKLLTPYAEKTYQKTYNARFKEYMELGVDETKAAAMAEKVATEQVAREYEQGFQGWEYKFNTVGSSRGDYPFITVTSGLDNSKFGIMCNKIMFRVHMEGQGAKGKKKPVLFPKYVYLFDRNINGPETEVFEAALKCSAKTMYPDWLSLDGEGYVPSMYKKYGKVVSPMGKCKL